MKILKKLSMSSINNFKKGEAKSLVEGATGEVFAGRILGSARKFEIGQSTYGPFFAFSGDFRAWDIRGEECVAVKAFLPAPADQLLANQITEVQAQEGNAGKSVEFGFDLFIVSDDTEVGYKFVLKTLIETKASDPVAAIAAAAPALKLAAPKEPTPTDAPALGNDKPETPAETAPESQGSADKTKGSKK